MRTAGDGRGWRPERRIGTRTVPSVPTRGAAPPDARSPAAPALDLQRLAGNAAVTRTVAVTRSQADAQRGDVPAPVRRSAVPGVPARAGRPLESGLRREMETAFGADFSSVRVHTGAGARDSAAEIGASAYTSGEHIVLGSGVDRSTIAHELTHVVQQRRGPVAGVDRGDGLRVSHPDDPFEREADATARTVLSGSAGRGVTTEATRPERGAAPAVQRKVGFEFETRLHPWIRLRSPAGGGSLRQQLGRDRRVAGDEVVPVPRKGVLERGRLFDLEADDSPGPTLSNSEFVTRAFEETPAGMGELLQANVEMLAIAGRLNRYVGRRGPDTTSGGPPFRVPGRLFRRSFIEPHEHRLRGSGDVAGPDLLFSGGAAGLPVRMQVTSGVPLSDMVSMMESLGRPVPGETPAERRVRDRRRGLIHPLNQNPEPRQILMGAAPFRARRMVDTLQAHPAYAEALATDTTDFTGFLAALVMSASMLQTTMTDLGFAPSPTDLIKDRFLAMPRNDFAQMVQALPRQQQRAIRRAPDAIVDALVGVLQVQVDVTARSPVIPPSRGFGGAAMAHEQALATLTIRDWIRGIAAGRDYLTQRNMSRWLSADDSFADSDKEHAAGAMESIGSYRGAEYREDTGEQLFKFEHRTINQVYEQLRGGRGQWKLMTLQEATQHAVALLQMFMDIRNEGAAGRRSDQRAASRA